MAYPKRVAAEKNRIEDEAIEMYSGLIRCVRGYLSKYKIEEILEGKAKDGTEILWLQKAYKKICAFAETARLKQMPNKVEGNIEHSGQIEMTQEQYRERVSRLLPYASATSN